MSNNSPSCQSQESTKSNSKNSIEQNVNLDTLQKSASNVFHIHCTSIQEFSEGGFHKVYILKMEDGKEYIGRIPKYEELYKLVPKYFPNESKTTFVLMHGDFHSSNILVNDDEILEKFFRDEISRRNPDFIRIFDNINLDEEKKEFYFTVFSQE
ncbi:25736_t:CDS:2, partial [Racocetra persica]